MRLDTPTHLHYRFSDGFMWWKAVPNATHYRITHNDKEVCQRLSTLVVIKGVVYGDTLAVTALDSTETYTDSFPAILKPKQRIMHHE